MLGTVFFYNFIVLSSTFFVYFSEKCKYRFDRNILLFIALLIIFIPSAIRYNIGTDFPSYIYIYNNMEKYSHIESGFYYLNKLLIALNLDAQWSIASLALIFSYVAILSYPKQHAWYIHMMFMLIMLLPSFNIIRQAIAIVFCLLAVRLFLNEKIIKALLIIFFASLFHKSALILILVGAISLIPIPTYFKLHIAPTIFILIILMLYFFSENLIRIIEFLLLKTNSKYSLYLSDSKHYISSKSLGTGIVLLANMFFSCFIISKSKQLILNNSKYWGVIIALFIYAISITMATNILIFGRLMLVFTIFPLIGTHAIICQKNIKIIVKLIIVSYIFFVFTVFLKESLGIPSHYSDPMLNPYQTILSKP